jgi:hypothetical protein
VKHHLWIGGLVALSVACPGSPGGTSDGGTQTEGSGTDTTTGTTGTTAAMTTTGSTGSTSTGPTTSADTTDPTTSTGTSSTTSSSTTGLECDAPANDTYANFAGAFTDCATGVEPAPNEDGTFAVTVFGPFASAFELEGFTFAAGQSQMFNHMITDPWTATLVVVPAGEDPTAVDPSATAQPYPLTLVEAFPAEDAPEALLRYMITLAEPLAVAPCDHVVVALRNTYGPPNTGLPMCGASSHPATNLWWNLDGTMSVMSSFGPQFAGDWWTTLVPAG